MAGPTVRKLRKLVRLRRGEKTVDQLVAEMAGNAPVEETPEPVVKEKPAPVAAPVAAPKAAPAKKETKAKK